MADVNGVGVVWRGGKFDAVFDPFDGHNFSSASTCCMLRTLSAPMQGGICAIQEDILRGRNVEHEGRPFSSTENLEAMMRKGAWFNLFCLDICMAGKSGMEFAWELRSWDERAGVFFITTAATHI